MNPTDQALRLHKGSFMTKFFQFFGDLKEKYTAREREMVYSPLRVMVFEEVSDQVRSWSFIILGALMVLTCMGSLYTALTNLAKAVKPQEVDLPEKSDVRQDNPVPVPPFWGRRVVKENLS